MDALPILALDSSKRAAILSTLTTVGPKTPGVVFALLVAGYSIVAWAQVIFIGIVFTVTVTKSYCCVDTRKRICPTASRRPSGKSAFREWIVWLHLCYVPADFELCTVLSTTSTQRYVDSDVR